MARGSGTFKSEKRKKELMRQKKQEKKRQKRAEKDVTTTGDMPIAEDVTTAEAPTTDDNDKLNSA